MSSEVKNAKITKKQPKKTQNNKTLEYKDLKIEDKIYCKIIILLNKFGIDHKDNDEVAISFKLKLDGLFSMQTKYHQLEALEFILVSKPKDIIEVYHLLNMFTVSDYMRMINNQLHSKNINSHEQNQEYIKIAGKTMEQYSKGMLALKTYKEGLPQFNKVQNNTLNQLNIHAQKEEKEMKSIKTESSRANLENNTFVSECKESLNARKVAIKKKEEV
ncbi:MAG: hypothetical protein ACI9CD_000927 [Candidatus Deianiraeaceae bacterium]|jgi:hypothetical protein